MTQSDRELVDLGVGQPNFPTPEHIKEAARRAIAANFTRYTPQPGFDDLREAIAHKFRSENQVPAEPEQVVVSCGAKHTLYNVFQRLLEPDAEVLVFTPHWYTYADQVRAAGGKPVLVPASEDNGFLPTVEAARAAVTGATKALVINSPCNPTGAVFPETLLRGLADLALAHDLTIVADEVYERILFGSTRHVSSASLGPDVAARTVTVNSVSKTHSMTGWRIGYAAMPKELAESVTHLQSMSTSGPCAVSQRAALAALTEDQSHVSEMVAEYAERRQFLLDRLARMPALSCVPPNGAFYLFLNVSGVVGRRLGGRTISDARDFANALLEEASVKVSAATEFGAPLHVRLSFAAAAAALEEGMDRIERLLV